MYTRHPVHWFALPGESARNWLALGLLLAAWNLSDDVAARSHAERAAGADAGAPVTVRTFRAGLHRRAFQGRSLHVHQSVT